MKKKFYHAMIFYTHYCFFLRNNHIKHCSETQNWITRIFPLLLVNDIEVNWTKNVDPYCSGLGLGSVSRRMCRKCNWTIQNKNSATIKVVLKVNYSRYLFHSSVLLCEVFFFFCYGRKPIIYNHLAPVLIGV